MTTAASPWRRRLGLAAVAAGIATAVAVPAALLVANGWPRHRDNLPRACPITEQSSPAADDAAAPPTVMLVAGPSIMPTFPLTPSYLPFGVQQPPTLSLDAGTQKARYGGPGPDYEDITLQTSKASQCDDRRYTMTTRITVQGQPGTLAIHDDDYREVTVSWRHKPGQWVTVTAVGEWKAETVVRVAEGLRDAQQTVQPSWRLAPAPTGAVIEYLTRIGLNLQLPGPARRTVKASAFRNTDFLNRSLGEQVTGGERPSWLLTQDGEFHLTTQLAVSTWIEVEAPVALWSEAEFRRFAAGVDYIGLRPPPLRY